MIAKPCQCAGCGKPITAKAKTGRCRVCKNHFLNSQPDFKAARAAGNRKKWEDPDFREKMRDVCKEIGKANRTDPVRRAKLVEIGKNSVARLHSPENRAKVRAKQDIIARKISERAMAWCPVEYRESYRHLTLRKNIVAADARKIILAQVRKDQERETAKLSPFERQMRALERGGVVVDKIITKGTLDRPAVYNVDRRP